MNSRPKRQSLDDRLEALRRLERRRLLLRLSATDSRADSSIEFGEPDRAESESAKFVTLRQLHLPVLEEQGFVRWDRERHQVTRGPRFDELEPYLEQLREIRDELPGRWV